MKTTTRNILRVAADNGIKGIHDSRRNWLAGHLRKLRRLQPARFVRYEYGHGNLLTHLTD